MSTKLSEESSAFETAWQSAGSRKPPCPIHQRCPRAKTTGLLQALKWEQRWHWWIRSEQGSRTLVHDWGFMRLYEDEHAAKFAKLKIESSSSRRVLQRWRPWR